MKLVYIHTDPLPSPMAGSIFALNTAIGLAKAGHETILIMPSAGQSVEDALAYYDIDPPDNLKIVLPASQKMKIGPIRFTYTPKYYQAVRKVIETQAKDADGVIVRTLKLAAYLTQPPITPHLYYEIHNWYGDIDKKWEGARWMISRKKLSKEKALSKVEKTTLHKVYGLIAMRNATAALMKERMPNMPITVAPSGLNAPSKLPEVSSDPVAVYAGQLHPHKGIEILLEAARLEPKIRLRIVGGGEWLKHWQKEAIKKGIESRVEFTGHVPSAQVPAELAKGRVGVLPMLDCFFNRYLTSPSKIMEYYAAGLPVITADGPVTSEVVLHEKTGLLTPFEDPAALAKAILRLSSDEDLHASCRANIERMLPKQTWQRRGQIIGEFIKKVGMR